MGSSIGDHLRLVEAMGADGRRLSMCRETSAPSCPKTPGAIPTIHVSDLFIIDLMAPDGFKVRLLSFGGRNAKLAVSRLLGIEIQVYTTLLGLPVICASHGLNNSAKWGAGNFGYGSSKTAVIVISYNSVITEPERDVIVCT